MRIAIGWVVFDTQLGKPYAGNRYSAGAKVYKSEAYAKAAVKKHTHTTYEFVEAFVEAPTAVVASTEHIRSIRRGTRAAAIAGSSPSASPREAIPPLLARKP